MHNLTQQKTNSVLLGFSLFFTMFIMLISQSAYALIYSDIVVTDLWLDPPHPQAGDKTSIGISVYNGGTVETKHHASTVTVGFFIDGELRKIKELGNVEPGESNQVIITTDKFWDAEWGKHKFTAIIDYHDTLPDMIDNPKNNQIEKIIDVTPKKEVLLDYKISPQYLIPTTIQTVTFSGKITDKDTSLPLSSQKLILTIDNLNSTITTDKNGSFLLTKSIQVPSNTRTSLSYSGVFPYESTHVEKSLYVIPQKFTSALVLQINDPKLDFVKNNFDVVIYQDTYDKEFTKLSSSDSGVLLDSNTIWVPLQDGHSYLEEIYLEGRYYTTINWSEASKSTIIEKNIRPTDSGLIQFHVSDSNGQPASGILVNNWIYSSTTDDAGLTEWIDTISTVTKKEPYVASVSINGTKFYSDSFLVSSGEKKIIEIQIPLLKDNSIKIPSWIKNSANWWSQDSISDVEFSNGIRYLIKQNILIIPHDASPAETGPIVIPSWVKQTSGWWANNQVTDNDFISSIQYLIKIGAIRL